MLMTSLVLTVAFCVGLSAEPVALEMVEAKPIEFPLTHHVQGLAADGARWFVTSVERAAKTGWLYVIDAKTMKLERSFRLALGNQFHPGGVQYVAGKLYIPLAEYRAHSSASILVIETKDFRVLHLLAVEDHIGACAATDTGELYLANWDSKDIYTLSPEGEVTAKRANPTGVAYQDWKYDAGKLWSAGNTVISGQPASVVDVLNVKTLALEERYVLRGERRTGGADFSHEGFERMAEALWLLPEDGPNSTVYRFELTVPGR